MIQVIYYPDDYDGLVDTRSDHLNVKPILASCILITCYLGTEKTIVCLIQIEMFGIISIPMVLESIYKD